MTGNLLRRRLTVWWYILIIWHLVQYKSIQGPSPNAGCRICCRTDSPILKNFDIWIWFLFCLIISCCPPSCSLPLYPVSLEYLKTLRSCPLILLNLRVLKTSRIVKMWPHVNSHKVMTSPNLLSPHLLSSPPLLLYSPCLSAWQHTRHQPFSLDSGLSPGTAHRGHRTIRCLKRVSTKYMNKYDFCVQLDTIL